MLSACCHRLITREALIPGEPPDIACLCFSMVNRCKHVSSQPEYQKVRGLVIAEFLRPDTTILPVSYGIVGQGNIYGLPIPSPDRHCNRLPLRAVITILHPIRGHNKRHLVIHRNRAIVTDNTLATFTQQPGCQ